MPRSANVAVNHIIHDATDQSCHFRAADSPNCAPIRSPPDSFNTLKRTTEDILQTIIKTRKSWKTLKGNVEAVWPPYLEAAMLNGLQEYEPDDSRETRILGRYPMRNRFISEYVFRTTGKYRSAKQVGSRLQQLRDTSEGRELMESLTRCYHVRTESGPSSARFNVPHQHAPRTTYSSPALSSLSCDLPPSDSSSSSSSADSPVSPPDYSPLMPSIKPSIKSQAPANPRTVVHIDILPTSTTWMNQSPSAGRSSHSAPKSPSHSHLASSSSHPSNSPRLIRNIDPTVTFVSQSTMTAKSSYIVLLDGAPIHSEDTRLQCVGPYVPPSGMPNASDSSLLYSTTLVPKFWETLCNSSDPTVYTIMQDVYRIAEPTSFAEPSHRPRPLLMFSAVYHFRYPSAAASPVNRPPRNAPKLESPVMTDAELQSLCSQITPLPFEGFGSGSSQKFGLLHDVYKGGSDAPFLVDVSLDDFNFDDFTIDLQNSPAHTSTGALVQSTSACFPTDLSNYVL
ncbi:hypothetical protein BV22DRAFT_1029416 [Leucogyrophana mollusca]|uniref:Uncharacterized protein n=1 Tax=Leucogyrophana mollusca TaxID=85980 RepID=A0ACB8BV27_9AGAM|nr:hypothetical protein BV22DRAFT_1029416 [Leucogyrophana mollusca]